ncbi:MAG: SUMF1/EgtB/PvdO family nonheme iron enzyme [Acidobacteriota bacterium]
MADRQRSLALIMLIALATTSYGAQNPTGRDIPAPAKKSVEKKPARANPTPTPTPVAKAAPKPTPTSTKTTPRPTPTVPPAVTPATARLIVSAPAGARIELDGRTRYDVDRSGRLIISDLTPGPHQMTASAPGHEPWRGVVEVQAPATGFTVPLRTREMTGRLTLFINEPGSEVFIDDQPQGVRSVAGQPVTISGLRPGPHTVRATRPGYFEWREIVQLSAGLSRTVMINLKARLDPEVLRVPGGEFAMGDDNGSRDARPAHSVLVGDFEIALSEVTNRDYKQFVDATGHAAPMSPGWDRQSYRDGIDDAPVVGVSWEDADEFCRWVSQTTGKRYRLPTEAEWEKAVRTAGTRLSAIGRVWEWCQDWYDINYYRRSPRVNPAGPQRGQRMRVQGREGEGRVIRGGQFRASELAARVIERGSFVSTRGRGDIGFRLVRDVRAR